MADAAAAKLNKVALYKSQITSTATASVTVPASLPSEYLKRSDNMLVNGSFELPVLTGLWSTFDTGAVPGWKAEWLDKNCLTTPQIEIQHKNLSGITADFDQYAEVDSDNACTTDARINLTQTLATIPHHIYELSFRIRARDAEHNSDLNVSLDQSYVFNFQPGVDDWQLVTVFFEATQATTVIGFTDAGAGDTFGPLIDAVAVRELTVDTEGMPQDQKKKKKGGGKNQSFENGRRHKDCKKRG